MTMRMKMTIDEVSELTAGLSASEQDLLVWTGDALEAPEDLAAKIETLRAAPDRAEKLAARKTLLARSTAYARAYDKSGSADPVQAIGFLLDDLLGMIEGAIAAGQLTATPEVDAALAARAKVKLDHPLPRSKAAP